MIKSPTSILLLLLIKIPTRKDKNSNRQCFMILIQSPIRYAKTCQT